MIKIKTHCDLDGLVSGIIFEEMNDTAKLDSIEYPQNIREDYTAPSNTVFLDLPAPKGYANIDHHVSNPNFGIAEWEDKHIYVKESPSAAHLVWELFGGVKLSIIREVDKVDSADYTPRDFVLKDGLYKSPGMNIDNALSFHYYNADLLKSKYYNLVKEWVLTGMVPEEILNETREIIRSKRLMYEKAEKQWFGVEGYEIMYITVEGDNFIDQFLAYMDGADFLVINSLKTGDLYIGWNIFKKEECPINIGEFCATYDGGGHPTVGGCPFNESIISNFLQKLEVR